MKRRDFIKAAAVGGIVAGCDLQQGLKNEKSGAPAIQTEKKYKWKMVTTWPKDSPGLGTGANHLANIIQTMSGGRIEITVYGAGELVPAFESFGAVSMGVAQIGHGAAYYWNKKANAAQFFATVPFGLNAQEMSAWINYGGGQALWDELYEPFNLKPFAAGNTGVQMGGWFNKEIKSVNDYKGLKIRMPGLGGEVLKRAGAEVVSLPGGKIFKSLESGAIDATEWVGPYNDLAFDFYKAARYYYWPGWHEPGTVIESFINKSVYESLPFDLKELVKQAMKAAYNDMLAGFTARNNAALGKLLVKHGVTLKKFPEPVLRKMGKLSKEVVAEIASKDEMSRKVYQSFEDFRKASWNWGIIGETGFSLARSLVFEN